MLRNALGPGIARLLEDLGVVEVMVNPDGRLCIDRLSEGLSDTGERIVRLVAYHVGIEVHTRATRAYPYSSRSHPCSAARLTRPPSCWLRQSPIASEYRDALLSCLLRPSTASVAWRRR